MQKLSPTLLQTYLAKHSEQLFIPESCIPYLELLQFEKNEWLFQEGKFTDRIYFVLEGKAKVYMTQQNGKISLLHFIGPGAFVGDMELLEQHYYSKGVQASHPLLCFSLQTSRVRSLLLNDLTFLQNLCRYLGQKITRDSSKFSQSISFPLENRLAEFILISENDSIYKEKHTEVSAFLGVSYRHLLYMFAQFCDEGILSKRKSDYIILNHTRLEQLATTIFSSDPHRLT